MLWPTTGEVAALTQRVEPALIGLLTRIKAALMHHGAKPAGDRHAFDARDVLSNLASKIVKPS